MIILTIKIFYFLVKVLIEDLFLKTVFKASKFSSSHPILWSVNPEAKVCTLAWKLKNLLDVQRLIGLG